jgi:hypothetical protein
MKIIKFFPILLLVILIGCSQDNIESDQEIQKKSSDEITLNDLNSQQLDEHQQAIEILNKFRSSDKKGKQVDEIYYSPMNIFIQVGLARYITKEGFESYTFPVRKNYQDRRILNLVLYRKAGEQIKATFVHYDWTPEEQDILTQKELEARPVFYTPIDLKDDIFRFQKKKIFQCLELWTYSNDFCSICDGQLIGYHEHEGGYILASSACGWVDSGGSVGGGVTDPSSDYPSTGDSGYDGNPDAHEGGEGYSPYPDFELITSTVLTLEESTLRDILKTGISLDPSERELLLTNWGFALEFKRFLEENETVEAREFAENAIRTKIEYPDFKIDLTRSSKSPYIVDLDNVKPDPANPEPEKVKFMHIYDKLLKTSFFKSVISDVFGDVSTKMNVKFLIVEDLVVDSLEANGSTSYSIFTGENALVNNSITIKIDKAYLETQPLIRVAKTIVHEVVHTHLALVNINSPLATVVGKYSAVDFANLLDTHFETDEEEHNFIAQHYIPTISSAVEEILPLLEDQDRLDYIGSLPLFYGTENASFWNWNDFYKYLSWVGLNATELFKSKIKDDPVVNSFYSFYFVNSFVPESGSNFNQFSIHP